MMSRRRRRAEHDGCLCHVKVANTHMQNIIRKGMRMMMKKQTTMMKKMMMILLSIHLTCMHAYLCTCTCTDLGFQELA